MNKPNEQEATYSSNIPIPERRSRRNVGGNNELKVIGESSNEEYIGSPTKSNPNPLNVKSKKVMENNSHFNMPSTEQWVER